MYSEPSFPRGGSLKKSKNEADIERRDIKYGARTDHLERKVKPSKKQRKAAKLQLDDDETDDFASTSADMLNRYTIAEGMLLLGIIERIDEMCLDIALPGKMRGKVAITAISDPYSRLLEKTISQSADIDVKPLDKLFKKGQYVSVKVISLKDNPNYITLSVSPSDINAERHHGQLQKGLVIVGAVSDIEDHGYTIETNIKNVRAFLPVEKTKIKFSIGSLVYGCIDELTSTSTTCTIILKTNKGNDIGMLEIGDHDPVLDLILPGTVVPFTMTKILKNGLQGSIFETFKSYVNENYLTDPLHRPNDYSIGLQFDSRILYIMPLTKHVALTMNFNKVKFDGDEGILSIGHIVENAVSLGQSSGAILFKINKNSKGIVSLKSIKSKYKTNYDECTALLSYGKTTKHRLRVISYNAFERVYICTDKEELMNEPYFSINDLSPGDIVDAKITKVLTGEHKGLTIKVGQIKGFIHNLDCSIAHLKKGLKIKARVLSVDQEDKTALFTNRQEILRSSNILATNDQALVDGVYTGLIVKDTQALYLIRFFNKIKGVLFKNPTGVSETLHLGLKVGTVANFRISNIQGERIILKIASDVDASDYLGTIVSSKIECIHPIGAQVKVKRLNLTGNIRINHCSNFPEISEAVFNSLKEGQKVRAVNIMNNLFSIRDVEYFLKNPPLTLKDVQKGDILKCNVKSHKNGVVDLICPLKDFRDPIKLHVNRIVSAPLKNVDDFELKTDTPIYVRVESKLSKPKNLVVSARLEDVWNGNTDASVSLMQEYFHELDQIKEHLVTRKKAITFHHIGKTVTGTITERFDSHDILVLELPDGVPALCRNILTKNYNIGDTVTGKIVWIDYVRQVVDLITNSKAMSCINVDQSPKKELLNEKKRCKGYVVLVRDDVIIVSVGDKGPLVYLSTKFHTNDFQPTLINSLAQYGKCSIHLLKVVEGRVIGMFEDNYKQCQDYVKAYVNKYNGEENRQQHVQKRKRQDTEPENDMENFSDHDPDNPLEKEQNNKVQKKRKNKKQKNNIKNVEKMCEPLQNKKHSNENKPHMNIENIFENQLDGATDFSMKSHKKKGISNKLVKKKKNIDLIKTRPSSVDPKLNPKDFKVKSKNYLREHKAETKVVAVGTKRLLLMNLNSPKQISKAKINNKTSIEGTYGFWTSKEKSDNDSDDDGDADVSRNVHFKDAHVSKAEPNSVCDFDRLLILYPDDSKLWIKYMQFHMKAFEVEKAKGVGQRAIKVINYRNEREKLIVWMELLKLEINNGTNESFNTLFREAILQNQPLKIYSKALPMLIAADKLPQVNGLLGQMLKKYKTHLETWLIAAETYYRSGASSTAKDLLEKAYKSLPKSERKILQMFIILYHKL